jgi:hypothetical protein
MSKGTYDSAIQAAGVYVTSWTDRERELLKDTTRIGTWSLFGGTALFFGSAIGLKLGMVTLLGVGFGLSVGGLYTAFASGLLVRKLWRGRLGLLKLGALAGLPFGLTATTIGIWWLSAGQWLHAAAPVAVTLFVVLGLLLVVIFGGGLGREVWRAVSEEGSYG